MRGGGDLLLIKCEAVGGATNLLVILRGVHSFKGEVEYRRRRKREKNNNTLEGRELYGAIKGSSEDTDGCGRRRVPCSYQLGIHELAHVFCIASSLPNLLTIRSK